MDDGRIVALRDLSQLESAERSGHLVSVGTDWAELELTDGGEPVPGGALVGIQTSENVYLGQVESRESLGNNQRLRVLVNHRLALQDVSSIQTLWSQERTD
jgi:hypothetical protein